MARRRAGESDLRRTAAAVTPLPNGAHRRRPSGDTPAAEPVGGSQPDPSAEFANVAGHPLARGTLPMARYLTDPAIEEEIQQLAAEAPPMTEDQRARLSRLLRLNRRQDPAA